MLFLLGIQSEKPCYQQGSEKAIAKGGFVFPVYHELTLRRKYSFGLLLIKHNKRVCKRYEDTKCSVRIFGVAFEAVLAQIFYCRVGYSKSSHIAKITQLAIIFLSCKSVLPDALSDLDKQGRGKFSTAYRATTTQLLLNRLPIHTGGLIHNIKRYFR